jgi:hypothetical protein
MTQPMGDPIGGPAAGEGAPDAATLKSVKDLFIALSRAVSAAKLFPDNNEMVVRFRGEFASQLQAFLGSHIELEIEIRQNAFDFLGQRVWQDENVIRSLPYLFFKDGMKTLTFMAGIGTEEVTEFLSLVKTVSLLPLEVSDCVDALWQKDFANIRFYASDEFLEAKVPVDHKIPPAFRVDKEELFRGRLDLRAEDVAEVLRIMKERGSEAGPPEADAADRLAALDAADLKRLDGLLADEHRSYEEKDFLDLVFELLNVEERPDVFAEILTYMNGRHAVQVQCLDFANAVRMVKMLEPLSRTLAGASPERARSFEQFRAGLGRNCPWPEVRKAAVEGQVPEPARLFEYLALMGTGFCGLGADLYEDVKDKGFRSLAQEYLEKMGRADPLALARQVQESRPLAGQVIIGVLGQIHDPGTLSALAGFLSSADRSIRLKTIRTLGSFPGEEAQRILIKLLQDPDREARIEAALQVRLGSHPEGIRDLIRVARAKDFFSRVEAEASALLLALGRSGSEDAAAFLASLLRKRSLLGRAKRLAVQLGAVRALAAHGGPAAAEALARSARSGRRKLRPACREALDRLASNPAAGRTESS